MKIEIIKCDERMEAQVWQVKWQNALELFHFKINIDSLIQISNRRNHKVLYKLTFTAKLFFSNDVRLLLTIIFITGPWIYQKIWEVFYIHTNNFSNHKPFESACKLSES